MAAALLKLALGAWLYNELYERFLGRRPALDPIDMAFGFVTDWADPELDFADAAMGLGCTPLQAFFKVTLHEIMPGIVSGAIMAFSMSLDEFVISYFVSGLDFVTLPVEIYSYTKKPIQPKVYAMFTLLFLLIFILMVTMNILQVRGEQKRKSTRATADSKAMRIFKRAAAAVAVLGFLAGSLFLIFGTQREQVTLNVYNWGMNIADCSDDT